MVALDGVGVYPPQLLFRKIHVGREQKNLYCRIETLESSSDLPSIHLRHGVVKDNSRDSVTSKDRQSFASTGGCQYLVALTFKQQLADRQALWLVVYAQDDPGY